MLTKKRPETLKTNLTIEGQGESLTFPVTYHNRNLKDVDAKVEDGITVAALLLYLVAGWESEYELTEDGVTEMELDRPGIAQAIIAGFHKAREVRLVGN